MKRGCDVLTQADQQHSLYEQAKSTALRGMPCKDLLARQRQCLKPSLRQRAMGRRRGPGTALYTLWRPSGSRGRLYRQSRCAGHAQSGHAHCLERARTAEPRAPDEAVVCVCVDPALFQVYDVLGRDARALCGQDAGPQARIAGGLGGARRAVAAADYASGRRV